MSKIKLFIYSFLFYTRIFLIISYLVKEKKRDNFIVLMYHHIKSSEFANQINYLKDMNYNFLSFNSLLKDSSILKASSKNILVTFDDGYKSNFFDSYPVAVKYNLPLIIYLTTGYINNKRNFWWRSLKKSVLNSKVDTIYEKGNKIDLITKHEREKFYYRKIKEIRQLPISERDAYVDSLCSKVGFNKIGSRDNLSWKQIKYMNLKGIDFGIHTHNHVSFSHEEISTVLEDVDLSIDEFRKNLEYSPKHFAYPYGDFETDLVPELQTRGIETAVTTLYGFNDISTNNFLIRRLSINADDNFPLFVIKLSGTYTFFKNFFDKIQIAT